MRLDFVARHGLRILVFTAVVVVVMGCSNNTPTTLLPTTGTTGLTCTASGTALSSTVGTSVSVSNVAVSISGGTGPFTITLPGAAAVSSTAATYTYPGSVTVTTDGSGNSTSYVSVSDQSTGGATSCAISISGTGTGTGTGYYGGSVTCTLQYNTAYYYPGQQIVFWISTSDGESAYLTSLNTGEPYAYGQSPTFPMWAPFYISYSTVGPKYIYLTASTASGIPCNGGQYVTDSIFINSY